MLTERQKDNLFRRLTKLPQNSSCADCGVKGAGWTSLDFGVFICINCSGCHRSFGMHITRVRSIKLDDWTVNDSRIMDRLGNKIANAYFMHRSERKFGGSQTQKFGSSNMRRHFIKRKYVDKAWARRGVPNPAEALKDSDFMMSKKQLSEIYLNFEDEVAQSGQSKKLSGNPVRNSKRSLNLQNMKRSGKKRSGEGDMVQQGGDADLLNFDFGPVPGLQDQSRFRKQKPNGHRNEEPKARRPAPVQKPKAPISNQNLLDFDFLAPEPAKPAQNDDILDFSGFNGSKPPSSSNHPAQRRGIKPPPKRSPPNHSHNQPNRNMFMTNPVQNDKYNCLSMNSRPNYGRAQFASNPTYSHQGSNNVARNGENNQRNGGFSNGIQRGANQGLLGGVPGTQVKPKLRSSDKYDVFDYCKDFTTPGFL